MGITVDINSLEEMCDNVLPQETWWIFTFGCGQRHEGKYVRIKGTYGSARQKMFDLFGEKWAFQYSEEEWANFVEKGFATETEMKIIE